MILYLDTAALVPLLVEEAASRRCEELWDAADAVVTSRITYVEAAAAAAQAYRLGRLDVAGHAVALSGLDRRWSQIDRLPVDDEIIATAATLAHDHALRGYDAVHCASALLVADPALVAATGDRVLLHAWRRLGVDVSDTSSASADGP